MIRRTPGPTLFPYTTLFRSGGGAHPGVEGTIAQHAKAVRDHGRDVPLGREESRLPGHDHLGEAARSEEHTSELQSLTNLVCRLLLEKKNYKIGRALQQECRD